MLNYILKPIEYKSLHKKHPRESHLEVRLLTLSDISTEKQWSFMQTSVWVRKWALEHWAEGTQADELLVLKAHIQAETSMEIT